MDEKKIILITGANTGIGLETVKSLLDTGEKYHILLGGRNLDKAKQAAESLTFDTSVSSVETVQLDVESDESIEAAFASVSAKYERIDCLVNNAGASFDRYVQLGEMKPREAWNKAWDINVVGAHLVTIAFAPLLLKSKEPRLLFITSGLSSIELAGDRSNLGNHFAPAGLPKTQPFISYRSSKAGLNMLMTEWTKALDKDGVKVLGVAPGLVATSLGGDTEALKKIGAKDPRISGDAIRRVIQGGRDADVGKVVREYGSPILPW